MPVVEVDLPDSTIRDIQDLATSKGITPTEALVRAVETTKELFDIAPDGARIVPVSSRAAKRLSR